MHPRTLRVLLVASLFACTIVPGPARNAFALENGNKDASISLYLVPKTSPLRCSSIDPPDCENDVLLGEGELYAPYYAILAVFNGDGEEGIAGLSCGIEYNSTPNQGVEMWGWTPCTDGLEFSNGNWPASGGGNRITWTTCQSEEPGGPGTGVAVVFGFFYITAYSEDTFRIIENRNLGSGPELQVAGCDAASEPLDMNQAGWVGFSDDGSVKGNVLCGKPKEDATWGDVKARYGGR
jgi:hypothetical protein